MKKAFLFAVLLVVTGFVKAQSQSLQLNPPFSIKELGIKIDTVAPSLIEKRTDLSQLQKDKLNNLLALKPSANKSVYNEVFYSTMPVAGIRSNSNMPVSKIDDTRTRYNMPVKRIDIVDPTKTKPVVTNP